MKSRWCAPRSRPGARSLHRRFAYGLVACQASALLLGCPADRAKGGEPPATCAKSGDPCTFAPGKLGLCVESVDGARLLCQSQH